MRGTSEPRVDGSEGGCPEPREGIATFYGGGSIILNASTASIKGMPAFSVYGSSKAAVRSFARVWTNDLKDRSIRVNMPSPARSIPRF